MAYPQASGHRSAHLRAAIPSRRGLGGNRARGSLTSAGCHVTCFPRHSRQYVVASLPAVHQFLGSSSTSCSGSLPSSCLAPPMATVTHAPLVSRTPSLTLLDSPVKLRPTTKRARSPVPADQGQVQEYAIKRHKLSATASVLTSHTSEKERRKAEKLEKEAVWRAKYLEHFPRWIFFFDPDGFDQDTAAMRKKLIRGVHLLGAVSVSCFYSQRSAHLLLVGSRLFDR